MDSKLLLARIEDTLNMVYHTDKPSFLGFLSVEEAAFVEKFLIKKNSKFSFFGGEHNAQRVILCCLPDCIDMVTFPISAITVTYRTVDVLKHRDFLGSLMALGLKRETIGDILIEQGRAVIFLKDEIYEFVLKNLTNVGRVGVRLSEGYTLPLPETEALTEYTTTIASTRLDCIVGALANCSRTSANILIENGLVNVNSVLSQKPTKLIMNDDVLSIRHKGKFKIVSVDKLTKKQRIVLVYKKY